MTIDMILILIGMFLSGVIAASPVAYKLGERQAYRDIFDHHTPTVVRKGVERLRGAEIISIRRYLG